MRYVLDSNVALKWVLPERETPTAVKLRNEFRQGVHELLAPDVFIVEVAHAIAKAERRGIIPAGAGERRLLSVLNSLPTLHPAGPLLRTAFRIATRAHIGVYDCLYVALADRESCDLVTADQRLLNALQGAYPFIKSLASI